MRLFYVILVGLLFIACTQDTKKTPAAQAMAVPKSKGPLAIGSILPQLDTKMLDVSGESKTISAMAGEKGTLVIFTCNHCPYVKAWEERITSIGNEYSALGVGVIAINPNDPKAIPEDSYDEMINRSKKLGLKFPYVVDDTSDVARAFGASKTPEVFLFNAEKKLIYRGAIDDNTNNPDAVSQHYLRDALSSLLKSESITNSVTKALGCSIKWRMHK